jgi:hypothetical protein
MLTLTNVVTNFIKLFVKIPLSNTIRKQYFELDNYSWNFAGITPSASCETL